MQEDKPEKPWDKLKKIKNIEVIIGIFILAIILLVYAATTDGKKSAPVTASATDSYAETEDRLEKLLSEVDGAGDVSVMITYSGTKKVVTAESVEQTSNTKSDNSAGSSYTVTTTTSETSPVLSGGNAVILQELNPDVVGVVIVAEGARDIGVRLELLRLTATALNVDESVIAISAAKTGK